MAWALIDPSRGAFNGTTEVELIAAPSGGAKRANLGGRIYNLDTVAHNVSIRKKRSGPAYDELAAARLEPGDFLPVPECALTTTTESMVGVLGEAASSTNPTWVTVPVEQT